MLADQLRIDKASLHEDLESNKAIVAKAEQTITQMSSDINVMRENINALTEQQQEDSRVKQQLTGQVNKYAEEVCDKHYLFVRDCGLFVPFRRFMQLERITMESRAQQTSLEYSLREKGDLEEELESAQQIIESLTAKFEILEATLNKEQREGAILLQGGTELKGRLWKAKAQTAELVFATSLHDLLSKF